MAVALVIDKVPASTLILALPVNAIGPVIELVPAVFFITPLLFTPVPITLNPSLTVSAAASNFIPAPSLTIVFPAVVPKAVLFLTLTTPLLIFVNPV